MSKPKAKAKKASPHFYEGPPLSKEEKAEETDDIYDTEEREEMLEDDEVTAAEAGFMQGKKQGWPSKKALGKKAQSHDDSVSVELAKEDAEDD